MPTTAAGIAALVWTAALLLLARRAGATDFVREVQPIFAAHCYNCHGPETQKAGYRLDIRDIALKGGDDGAALVPGDASHSLLVRLVGGEVPGKVMPAKGDRLSPAQVQTLRAWIDSGADWPASATAVVQDKADFWSFKPIASAAVPEVKDANWVRNPIDRFILARLEAQGFKPAPPAAKATLLRRVTYDLTGLPPTPEELAAYMADDSSDAYEKVVDRLLASPRYGERWARHWMDLVHFAETHGNDEDRERPNAWPYRDYLVQSFNSDKPFTRFVREQLAGDVLYPDDPQGVVALGFIAAGPWDESSQMGILDGTVDKKIAQYLDRDDMVQTTICTFDSVTIGCARCHNHKFDPITQAEYYGLQSVFAAMDRADRPYDPDPKVHALRRSLLRQKEGLRSGRYAAGASPLDPAIGAEVAEWERSLAAKSVGWTALPPQQVESAGGSTLKVLPDLSVLASGARPDVDTYTITTSTDLQGVTALKLELLTDDSLPHHGPGRQDNGNLHVNELYVRAADRSGKAEPRDVAIASARADFDQDGWTSAMAIDRNAATAWGIYPQIGKPHAAVFAFKDPITFAGGATLSVRIEQTHGQGHLIGRFRLSATTSPAPALEAQTLPGEIAQVLATPPARRSEADRLTLGVYYLTQKIDGQLAALPTPHRVYAGTSDFAPDGNFLPSKGPRPVFVLHRGDVNQPGDAAEPGALSCVPGISWKFQIADAKDESARRGALAEWVSDPKNCLTWRSIVNRAWQYHFGRGIVATPNDFGHMGSLPSHPELLDWLAGWFLAHDTSLKQLDRLLVTSNAYRQSTQFNAEYAARDSENALLWRMNRNRLDAECVRDTLLQVSGLLDSTPGGPSAKQFLERPGHHVTPVLDYTGFDVDSPASRRLSVYRFIFRTLPDPFMDAMDCPDASQLTPTRTLSVTALQALAMWNDKFVLKNSEHLADRVSREAPDLPGRIGRIYELCLSRHPTDDEQQKLQAYAREFGLSNLCRVVINSNEFMFLN